jgi:hypothetical protein
MASIEASPKMVSARTVSSAGTTTGGCHPTKKKRLARSQTLRRRPTRPAVFQWQSLSPALLD